MRLWFASAFAFAAAVGLRADDWPQWLGPQRDGVWRESGIIESLPTNGFTYRWRTQIGGGYSGPAVAHGRVYVMDRLRSQPANAPAVKPGQVPGSERVLCLDERSGKLLWEHAYNCPYTAAYPAGPRATPTVHQGKVYTLGTEGHLHCLDATNGAVLWSRDFKADFQIKTPTWGFAGHPLIDGQKLICLVGGEGSVAVAFDKDTGKELWRALSASEPGYAPPTILEFAGKRQLILWHPEAVASLNPETGRPYWTHAFAKKVGYGMTIPTPRRSGDILFLTSFYSGTVALRVNSDEPTVVWQSVKPSEKDTDGLHTVMATPFIHEGHVYAPCSYGQFRCLKLETGERLWETFAPTGGKSQRWGNAFVIPHGDRAFLFSETGDLILARLTPTKYEELGRAHLIDAVNRDCGRPVVWTHPAFANRCIYVRNDQEIVSVSLAKP